MRSSFRKAIATLAVAGLSFTAAPYAFADEPTLQQPPVLVEPENPDPGLIGPFCGHHEKIKPLAMPTEASFLMSDGTTKIFPITLFKSRNSTPMTQAEWERIMHDPILDPDAWGDGVTGTVWVQINDREDTSFRDDAFQYTYRFERLIIWAQDDINVETPVGTPPELPSTVQVYIENEGMTYADFEDDDPRHCANPTAEGWRTVDVVWDEISSEDLKEPGTFTVGGTITVDGIEWERTGGEGMWGEEPGEDYGFDALATVTVVDPPTTTSTPPTTATSTEPTTETTVTPTTSTETSTTVTPTTSTETGTALPTTTESSTTAPVEPEETTTPAPGFDA
ncbi:Ig-like domain-containing protein, partial [Corynebacterium spheniscorum]